MTQPANSTEVHAVSTGDPSNGQGWAALTLFVDNTSRMVVGWHLVNNYTFTITVVLTEGSFTASRDFAPGDFSGSVPKGQQWNYDLGGSMSYEIVTPVQ